MISALLEYALLKIKRYKIQSTAVYLIIPVLFFLDKYFTGNFIGKTVIYLGNKILYAPFLIVCHYIGFLWVLFILDSKLAFDVKDRCILHFSGIKNYLAYRFFENSINAVLRNLLVFILAMIVLDVSSLVVLLVFLLSFALMVSTIPFTVISYCISLVLRKDAAAIYRVLNWGITIALPFFYSIVIYPKVVLWLLAILFPPAIFFEILKQVIFAKLVLDNLLIVVAGLSTIVWYFASYWVFKRVWKEVRRKGLLSLM